MVSHSACIQQKGSFVKHIYNVGVQVMFCWLNLHKEVLVTTSAHADTHIIVNF